MVALLVLTVIIAMPAAILFPVFTSGGEKAGQTACLSNSKPMGPAEMMYVQDYDARLSAARICYPVPLYQAVHRGTDGSIT